MFAIIHNKTAQALSGWAGLLTTIFTILGRLTPEWFGQLTWPQAILIGIAAALSTMLASSIVLAVGGYGFRLIRPLPSIPPTEQDDGPPTPELPPLYDDSGIKGELVALTDKFERVRVDTAIAATEIKKIKDLVEQSKAQSLLSFHTLGLRDALAEIESEIIENADLLKDQFEWGIVYDAAKWDSWDSIHNHWEEKLKIWLDSARWYAERVTARTLSVDDATYALDWGVDDNQFPNSDAVRRFKKFRTIHKQWLEVVPSVKSGMWSVAYGGLSDTEVRNGNAAG